MEKIIQIILLVLVITPSFAQTNLSVVNAIIGDVSFVERFGQMPRKDVDEKLRIETHLNYML